MSENRVTKSLHEGESTGSPQHVTRFYAEEACAEIRITPKRETAYEGNSAFVLKGYERKEGGETNVFEHTVSAGGQSPEADGTIKIRIRPGDGDGTVPLKKRLKELRYRLLHRPLGENKTACEYPLFEDASFEQAWGPEPMAYFDEVAFAETADVKTDHSRMVPDEDTLFGEETKSLRTHKADVQVETEEGEWKQVQETRPRWAYAFSVTEAEEGDNYVTIHEWKAKKNGKLARVDVEAGPSDDRTPESAAHESALLPTQWILAGPSAPDGQAHTSPEYGFWLSQEKLPAERLEQIEEYLSVAGVTRFMPVDALDPTLHEIKTPSGGPEWTRTVLLTDPFTALQTRYEQFRDPLNRLNTITNEAAPLRATANIAQSLATSNSEVVRSEVQDDAVPAQLKRVETGADVGPKYRLQPFRREEMRQGASEPLWKTWRSEYREQEETLRKEADEAAQRVVELFKHDTFKAAYVDYELGDKKSRMRADHLAGRARRGLNAVPSGREYMKSLVEGARMKYPGTMNLTASVNLLDLLWKAGRPTVKGTVSTFVEFFSHKAARMPDPESVREFGDDLAKRAHDVSSGTESSVQFVESDRKGGHKLLEKAKFVKDDGSKEALSEAGRKYKIKVDMDVLEQRIKNNMAELEVRGLKHIHTTVGGILELANVINTCINTKSTADQVAKGRLKGAQAMADLMAFTFETMANQVTRTGAQQMARRGAQQAATRVGGQALLVKGLRFSALSMIGVGASIEVVLAYHDIKDSLAKYDEDAAVGRGIVAAGILAMSIGSALKVYGSAGLLGSGLSLLAGVVLLAIGILWYYTADPIPVQWFEDTTWAIKDSSKELALRKPLLPELKTPKLKEAISNNDFQSARKHARKMMKAYEEKLVESVKMNVSYEYLGHNLPMIHVDVTAPFITKFYYAWLSLDLSSVEVNINDKKTSPLLYQLSSPSEEPPRSLEGARKLEVEAEHNIQLGLYDASWKEQITSSTREELEKKMHLVPVQNLEQRIPGETELEGEMEIHQFGTIDQYMKLSDTYFKDWVAG